MNSLKLRMKLRPFVYAKQKAVRAEAKKTERRLHSLEKKMAKMEQDGATPEEWRKVTGELQKLAEGLRKAKAAPIK